MSPVCSNFQLGMVENDRFCGIYIEKNPFFFNIDGG